LSVRIGIPRSLFYFRFIPLWETFFQELGAEVIVSEPTNRGILDDGVKSCVDEACLPVKLFHGHVLNLKDRVDYLFVPRFTSISKKEYICPEFGGLPDMVRHTLKDLPPLIDTEINMRRSESNAAKAAAEMAAYLGGSGRDAKRALKAALESYRDFRYQALCGVMPFTDQAGNGARDLHSGSDGTRAGNRLPRDVPLRAVAAPTARIAVIGHPYVLYDRYVSMDLLGKLRRLGADVRTMEMVDDADIREHCSRLRKPMFWNHGRRAYGAALHLAARGGIDGMICVTSFGCGIDSFINDLIERRVRTEYGIPFIIMTVDEHTGEAGFNTRLEAFTDMLRWRKADENNIPASG
jgi:predicted nucleotide-binding protein (sugar kinase/HSP70/actin superfamily)